MQYALWYAPGPEAIEFAQRTCAVSYRTSCRTLTVYIVLP
jgi:hypothetical protein